MGARQRTGSVISKGGDRSPLNSFIVARSSGGNSPRLDHFSPALWVKPGTPAKRHFTFTRNLPEIGLMVGIPLLKDGK